PATTLSRVVFPLPLGPVTASTSPGLTAPVASSRSTESSRSTPSPVNSTAGSADDDGTMPSIQAHRRARDPRRRSRIGPGSPVRRRSEDCDRDGNVTLWISCQIREMMEARRRRRCHPVPAGRAALEPLRSPRARARTRVPRGQVRPPRPPPGPRYRRRAGPQRRNPLPAATAPVDSSTPKIDDILTHPVHGPVRIVGLRTRTVRDTEREYVDLVVIDDE